jgi:hypothetical protein
MPREMKPVRHVWTDGEARRELERLMLPALLGFYEQCEVAHVFMRSEDRSTVSNVLTVVVLEEKSNCQSSQFRFLNDNPIEVKSIKKGTFGVARVEDTISS